MSSIFKKSDWVGREFKCLETGVVVKLTEDMVHARAFIGVGAGAIDLGDGFYSRRVGDIIEVKEKTMTCKAIVAAYLKTESGDGYLFLYDELESPDEFVELIQRSMGEELEYVYSSDLNVLYGDQSAYELALHEAIYGGDE